MLTTHLRRLILALLLVTAGCQEKAAVERTSSAPSSGKPPVQVAHRFLQALQDGNSEAARTCLTPLAMKRLAENNMVFAPTTNDNAKFRIGQVEMIDAEKALVETIWSEYHPMTREYTDERLTLALKLTQGKWGISGWAADMGPNQPPHQENFEEPGRANVVLQNQKGAPVQQTRHASQASQDPFLK